MFYVLSCKLLDDSEEEASESGVRCWLAMKGSVATFCCVEYFM